MNSLDISLGLPEAYPQETAFSNQEQAIVRSFEAARAFGLSPEEVCIAAIGFVDDMISFQAKIE